MTGPEHYREAQSCLELAAEYSDEGRQDKAAEGVAFAQAHATLALAAATIAPFVDSSDTTLDGPAADWREVTS